VNTTVGSERHLGPHRKGIEACPHVRRARRAQLLVDFAVQVIDHEPDVAIDAIGQVKQAASELLERRLPAEQASALAEKLASGLWTHDYPIWASTARALGLTVSTDMPDAVLELMKLYPQPVRTQNAGGVEYLPVPRQKEVAREA
jgi:hypothetical protein